MLLKTSQSEALLLDVCNLLSYPGRIFVLSVLFIYEHTHAKKKYGTRLGLKSVSPKCTKLKIKTAQYLLFLYWDASGNTEPRPSPKGETMLGRHPRTE